MEPTEPLEINTKGENQRIIVNNSADVVLTFVASGIVTLRWNFFIDKIGAIVDRKTSFLFAIVIGLVIPIMRSTESAKNR